MLSERFGEAPVRTFAFLSFLVVVFVFAGFGSVFKMTEFAATIVKQDIEGFGSVSIAIYLVGMVPIFFFLMWAILAGKFRDIERPKLRMFELHEEIERGGPLDEVADDGKVLR